MECNPDLKGRGWKTIRKTFSWPVIVGVDSFNLSFELHNLWYQTHYQGILFQRALPVLWMSLVPYFCEWATAAAAFSAFFRRQCSASRPPAASLLPTSHLGAFGSNFPSNEPRFPKYCTFSPFSQLKEHCETVNSARRAALPPAASLLLPPIWEVKTTSSVNWILGESSEEGSTRAEGSTCSDLGWRWWQWDQLETLRLLPSCDPCSKVTQLFLHQNL